MTQGDIFSLIRSICSVLAKYDTFSLTKLQGDILSLINIKHNKNIFFLPFTITKQTSQSVLNTIIMFYDRGWV